MNAFKLLLSVPLFVGLALNAQAPRAVPVPIEQALPASTYLAVRFAGLAACAEAACHLPLAPVVQAFVSQLPPAVREEQLDRGLEFAASRLQRVLQRAGVGAADLQACMGQPMVLAIGRLSIEGMGPSVALVIEEGPHGEVLRRCFTALAKAMARGQGDEVAAARVGAVEVQCITPADGPPVFGGSHAGVFVVTNSRGYLLDLISVLDGKAVGLGRASPLDGIRVSQPAAPLASLFVNLGTVNASLAPHLPYEASAWSEALGLGAVDSIYAAAAADRHGGIDVLHVGLGGSERGLVKAACAAPVDLAFASACSKNTVLFGASSLDIGATIDAFQRLLALLPSSARGAIAGEMRQNLGMAWRQMGTTPADVDRLIRAFGTQVGFALAIEKGLPMKPELLLRVSVRDAGPVGDLLQRLEGLVTRDAGLEWKTRAVGEHSIRFCNVQLAAARLQVSPCYVLRSDALWLASDVAAMVRALRQVEEPDESLAAEADIRSLIDAAAGASGVVHTRWFRGVELGWRNVETIVYPLLDSQRERLGFGSDSLPDEQAMANGLGTSSVLWRVDDDAVRYESRGTFTFGSLLAALGAVADEVLQRAAGKVF